MEPPALLQQYYALFNERRFKDRADLFTRDAVLEHLPSRDQEHGRAGNLAFARAWMTAFPDAVLTIDHVHTQSPERHEVQVVATGTHDGALQVGGWVFAPTGQAVTLRFRELLELRDGRIAFASLSFDLHQLVEQLVRVDVDELVTHLDRIERLGAELKAVRTACSPSRDVIDRLGIELDAARHTVRPYFKRH